jgi:hypothetical protein
MYSITGKSLIIEVLYVMYDMILVKFYAVYI